MEEAIYYFVYTLLYMTVLSIVRIPLWFLGWIVVPIAIPFAISEPQTSNETGWMMKRLPWWAWPWSNDVDGCYGDAAGRWLNRDSIGKNGKTYLNQLIWLAWRNPVNNLRQLAVFNANLYNMEDINHFGQEYVRDDYDNTGFQIVWMYGDGLPKSTFYWVHRWWKTERCLRIRFGFKIKPSHTIEDGKKGFTTSVNPVKRLHGIKPE